MKNREDTAVTTPIEQPRTTVRDTTTSAINVVNRHDENSIAIVAAMGEAGRKVTKRGGFLIRINKQLQQKKDFLKTTPRKLVLSSFIVSIFAYAGLLYTMPTMDSLAKYVASWGNNAIWVYRLGIVLPMVGSSTLIAEYCILSDGVAGHSKHDFNDRFGKLLVTYYDPFHHESTSAFTQHGYTIGDIHAHLSAHLGAAMPPDLTVKQLDNYLTEKLKIDRKNKRLRGMDKLFFLRKKLCPQTCTFCAAEPINEPSKPQNDA